MTDWEPISLHELLDKIQKTEIDLKDELWNFWQLIKVYPTKWIEKEYGGKGGGFWIVAICGTKVIWYNDIEEGFNISEYKTFGEIKQYVSNQDKLSWPVIQLFNLVKFSSNDTSQAEP
ncbi:hypothetical protein HH214_18150 [Mucilaginibacter robiniae]|uniref:Uncharacterized protein n=1 Tax=Mucilaginibacter robiniae TaxID=2728022 RepID=A0A7L5E5S2_9SPHI|nr:hypothetical protein [Mucilaginibacter robiniae]QJD97659.1 hypothetical protein HH214_18150 [Mucilaginibacter robiniae]